MSDNPEEKQPERTSFLSVEKTKIPSIHSAHASVLSAEKAKKPSKTSRPASPDLFDDTPKRVNRTQTGQFLDPNRIKSRTILSPIPNIEPRAEKYVPMPYIFRIPSVSTQGNVNNQSVRCPPFHILLDHALAVIWSLYSKHEYGKPLGINQLQWTLHFLNNIRDSEGKHPKDVAHCIRTISDALIEMYADLVNDVKHSTKGKGRTILKKPLATSSRTEVTPGAESADEDEISFQEYKGGENADLMVQQNIPFSINYADMITKSPEAALTEDEALLNASQKLDKESMVKFLCQWRKDQMEKIFAELDRLSSIETYIGNATDIVEPYMCPEDRELHALLAQKIKSRAEEKLNQK